MTFKKTLMLASNILKKLSKESPDKNYTNSQGESMTLQEVSEALTNLVQWIYPELQTDEITKIVRCKNCIYWKRFKKKNSLKNSTFYACRSNLQQRDPEFFCKYGESK